MNHILNKNLFLVKEHVGMFKAANNFDVFDPSTSELLFNCREEKLGFFTKLFRFTKYKTMTPIHLEIKTADNQPVLSMKRGSSFFGFAPLTILDENGATAGTLKRKFKLGGAKIEMNGSNGQLVYTLKGNFIGWDFKIYQNDRVVAEITKKWAGIGKELFTSADNYILNIYDTVAADDQGRILMMAGVLCIDFLLKEN